MLNAAINKEEVVGKQKLNSSLLYDLRMKYERATVTDFDGVASSMERTIDDHVAETGNIPPDRQLLLMGDVLDYVAENIEREALEREINSRTAEEWRKLEWEHVVRSEFSVMDMYDVVPESDWSQYRECKHRFCINVWKPRRKNQQYCDDRCRKSEEYSLKEYDRTSKMYANGTYLPVFAYKEVREKQEVLDYQKHERLFDPHILVRIQKKIELAPHEGAQPRDRDAEERKNRAHAIERDTKRAESVKSSAVVVTKVSPDYLTEKYGDYKLENERKRAEIFGIGRLNPPTKPR